MNLQDESERIERERKFKSKKYLFNATVEY